MAACAFCGRHGTASGFKRDDQGRPICRNAMACLRRWRRRQGRDLSAAAGAEIALYDALLPLCDDLPGEPPALLAWAPGALARRVAVALTDNGWEVRRAD